MIPKDTRVLLIQFDISPYRVETFNLISDHCDFTVAYCNKDLSVEACRFNKAKFSYKRIGPIYIFGNDLYNICKDFDVIIMVGNIRYKFVFDLPRKFPKKKFLTWNIGFRVSYTVPYITTRKHNLLDYIMYRLMCKMDANILYMDKAKEFWANTKLDMNKCFTAINTVKVLPIDNSVAKDSILFVGTLYQGKGVDKLITAYAEALQDCTNCRVTLEIVGNGEMKEALEEYVAKYNLQDKIHFHGAIYDEALLSTFFEHALACISPTQAGLTVPKAMGYGVPMITRKDAITGGEIYHISNGINGLTYERDTDLPNIIKEIFCMPEKYKAMGEKAKEYYKNNATPRHQADGVLRAVEYALN